MSVDAVRKKEQEWRDAVDAKFRASHEALKSRDFQIKQLKEQLETLEADFRYNLTLLADRDADLERFESANERLRVELERKEELANDWKIKFEDARIASRHNFLDHEDHRRNTEKSLVEKEASITELKSELERTLAQCARQLELEREKSHRRLQDLASDAGRRCSKLKEQYANAISRKKVELETAVAQSELRARRQAEQVEKLQQDLQVRKNEVHTLQTYLASVTKEINESQAAQKIENEAQLGVAASTMKDLASKLDKAGKEVSVLRLEGDSLREKLAEAEKKIAERERILDMMGKRNLPLDEKIPYKDEEFQQLKKQNNVLRCVIKEMKRKMRGEGEGEAEIIETNLKTNEIISNENDMDEQRVSQLENAIGLLKMQMFQNLRDKLASRENGTKDPKDPNFGEVRILLLEQKLDKATENIGKTVALEKKELLAEMKNVRKEIASKLTSENLLGNSLVVSKDVLKSDRILEGVRKDILRLESKIGKIRRENDIEIIERERVERGVGMHSLMRHDIVTRHEATGNRRVDTNNLFYLPIPPMQLQGSTINTNSRKVAIHEKKTLHTKIRNYNIRD